MYFVKRWYGLTLKGELPKALDPVRSLDVSILQEQLLDPILGIKDVRTDKRIDFIGGIRGTQELERLVDSGKAAIAFSLYPTTVEDLIRVSDAGSIMPPSSAPDEEIRALMDKLREDHDLKPRAVDGNFQAAWLVLDYFDVIVHVMRNDVREHYDLEGLWGDAPRLRARRRAVAKSV